MATDTYCSHGTYLRCAGSPSQYSEQSGEALVTPV
jgi:hypothetical protein